MLCLPVTLMVFIVITELGADDDIFPRRLSSLTEKLLASSPAVAWCGVEEVAPRLERLLQDVQCFILIVDSPIGIRHNCHDPSLISETFMPVFPNRRSFIVSSFTQCHVALRERFSATEESRLLYQRPSPALPKVHRDNMACSASVAPFRESCVVGKVI